MEYLEESLDDWLGEELQVSMRSRLHAPPVFACPPKQQPLRHGCSFCCSTQVTVRGEAKRWLR